MWIKSLTLAAATFAIATSAQAQPGGLVGSWRAVANIGGADVEFDLVVQPNGAFSETEQAAGGMTMQTGEVQDAGQDMIAFVVEDWQPRSMPVYHPTGTVGGYYTDEPTAKPPGGVWRLTWNGSNEVTMQDVQGGGAVTFERVQ